MTENWLEEKDDWVVKKDLPFISFSQINRYLTCPEQFRLYYIERLRLRVPKASLVFGSLIHLTLAHLFNNKAEPVKFFTEVWDGLKQVELTYSKKDSWEKLRACGEALLTKFVKEELPRITSVRAVEKRFELNISNLDLPLVGIIDLIAEIDGAERIVDFKTADKSMSPADIELSDQLTTYQLAEPDVKELALWVLLKTASPEIQWHATARDSARLAELLHKAGYVAKEIKAGQFFRRAGWWCQSCDFLPICLGDKHKTDETLVRLK